MPYCETEDLYDRLRELLMALSDGKSPSDRDRSHLTQLLDEWDDSECQNECRAGACPFAKREDWIAFHGWVNLYELIESLDQTKPIDGIPKAPSLDALSANWARRPGHYNP